MHTPGPWAVSEYKGVPHSWGSIVTREGTVLAYLVTSEANARLLALAPELLAELETIANTDTSDWDYPCDFKEWVQNRARCFIAKATLTTGNVQRSEEGRA